MCGITGWVDYSRDLHLSHEQEFLASMTGTMSLRGPDAKGTWSDKHCVLGHQRLSIIDIEGGVQPMIFETPEGSVVLTYSGEVYNFQELRRELQSLGHQFTTVSDTEVVLHAYLEWPDFAERLNGMYAFAIWDGRTQKLVMVRDRMGIKPLYYYPTLSGVVFGSEPKAIFANPITTKVVKLAGLREAFIFSKTPGHAIWEGMNEVRPGEMVIVDRNGLRTQTYWALQSTPHTDDLDTTIQNIRGFLNDIIQRQLISDVPLCQLLSGGLDSSVLTMLGAKVFADKGDRLRTFTVDFVDQADFIPEVGTPTLDTPFAHDVAELARTLHEDIIFAHGTLADPSVRRACIQARDLPNGFGDRDLSLYLMFKEIKKYSTVALSGESGDEIFGGYPSYFMPQALEAGTFPWVVVFPIFPTGLLSKEFLGTLDMQGYQKARYQESLTKVPTLDGETAAEKRMREVCWLHIQHLLPVMLDRKDRMSMASGLEVRVPYCDHRLVEYVFNAPWAMKCFDKREKSLLRAAASDVLPKSVVERQKSGYPATRELQYVVSLQEQAKQILSEGRSVLDMYDREQVQAACDVDPTQISRPQRSGLERLLDMDVWIDIHNPELVLSS